MAGQRVAALRSFRELFHSGPVSGLDDGQLLERFATRHDEAAFARAGGAARADGPGRLPPDAPRRATTSRTPSRPRSWSW